MRLGRLIRAKREAAGFSSARAFAREAGIDPAVLWRLENGEQKSAYPDNLARIAQALGVTLDELLKEAARGRPEDYEDLDRPSFAEYIRSDRNLKPRQREALVQLYEEMVRGWV